MFCLRENGQQRNSVESVRASATDSLWFEAHPKRSYLLRPVVPGEILVPAPAPYVYAAVRQIMPGARARLFVAHDKPVTDWSEQHAADQWHFAASLALSPEHRKFLDDGERQGRRLS